MIAAFVGVFVVQRFAAVAPEIPIRTSRGVLGGLAAGTRDRYLLIGHG